MTYYNMSFIENSSGPLVLMQGISDNSSQWFAGTLIVFVFLILLVTFKKSGNQDAFLASSFITSILAGLAMGFGLLSPWTLSFPITMFVISLVMKVWGEG